MRPCGRAAAARARQGGRRPRGVRRRTQRRALPEPEDEGPLYAARRKIYPQRVTGTFRRIKWIVLLRHARHLLPAAVRALGPRAERARPGGADRFPEPPLLFLLHRDLAAGSLLPHRPADPRGDGAVPDERGRRPRLVRLSLPADGVDRPVPGHRALGRRRPPRASCSATSGPWTAERLARSGAQAFPLADGGVVDRRRLGALFRRRADAGEGSRDLPGAARRLCLDRHPHRSPPMRSPATCASRSASTCARGRASRPR